MHGTTRYLRASVEVTDGRLVWDLPRTILGIVPIGTRRIDLPVVSVRSIGMGYVFHPIRLLAAAALVAVPFLIGAPWLITIPLILAGLWVTLVSFGPHLKITTNTGKRHHAGICFGHQFDAELYTDVVKDMIPTTDTSIRS